MGNPWAGRLNSLSQSGQSSTWYESILKRYAYDKLSQGLSIVWKKQEDVTTTRCTRSRSMWWWTCPLWCVWLTWGALWWRYCRELLKQFTTLELMRWASLVEDYGKELREGSPDSPATDVFCSLEEGEKRWKDLKNRVVEHVSSSSSLLLVTIWWTSDMFTSTEALMERKQHLKYVQSPKWISAMFPLSNRTLE